MIVSFIYVLFYTGLVHAKPKYSDDRIPGAHIIGGKNTSIEAIPYQADLGHCGGAIIGKTWILTAAHCGHISIVRVGSSIRRKGIIHRVAESFIHPAYHTVDEFVPMYDFQLLKLQKELQFQSGIHPIPLGKAEDIQPEQMCSVSGWGMTSNGRHSVNLLEVNVSVLHDSTCEKIYGKYFNEATFCAGNMHSDSCDGDSGGPISSNGKLIGVVSYGFACGSTDYPGVYARVPAVIEWIQNITTVD